MNRKQALNILGLREDEFTEDKLKKEYRAKILEYHPDKNKAPDASAKFIEIQEAYGVLKTNCTDNTK
jgi:molecular chaperone DnaJ